MNINYVDNFENIKKYINFLNKNLTLKPTRITMTGMTTYSFTLYNFQVVICIKCNVSVRLNNIKLIT